MKGGKLCTEQKGREGGSATKLLNVQVGATDHV